MKNPLLAFGLGLLFGMILLASTVWGWVNYQNATMSTSCLSLRVLDAPWGWAFLPSALALMVILSLAETYLRPLIAKKDPI